jgi:hypothetical protein
MATNQQQQQQQHLVLPHEHPLSLRLALQASELDDLIQKRKNAHLPHNCVLNCRVLSPGLVELTLQAGDPAGYGSRSWPVRVGGAGLGDDCEYDDPVLAAMLGESPPRAPIAVRFAVPIELHGVDDSGFCDASFFESSTDAATATAEPTLLGIAETAVSWLKGSHLIRVEKKNEGNNGAGNDDQNEDEDEGQAQQQLELGRRREQWVDAEQHTSKRLDVTRQYADTMAARGVASLLLPVAHSPLVMRRSPHHILPEWIVPALRPCFDDHTMLTSSSQELDWKSLVTEVGPGIYAFSLFTPEFCDLFVQEVDSFEATSLPCRRPNTMNRLGLVVNDIGFEPFMTEIVERLVAPMCKALYPDELVTCALDHHHSFVVRYRNDDDKSGADGGSNKNDNNKEDGNKGLDMHHDASEATLNVCLGRDNFTSGGLRFCGRYGDSNHRASSLVYSHTKGRAVLHLGRHRHGADDICMGERMNLIIWARNSAYRGAAAFGHVPVDGSPHEKAIGEPDRLCLSKANDRDYEEQLKRFDIKKRRVLETK